MLNDILNPNKDTLLAAPGTGTPNHFLGSQEMYIVFGIIVLLVGLLFFWAAYIRKPNRRIHSSRSRNSAIANKTPEPSRDHQKKKRHRRWKNRNPTLSQIGGLPPPKPESSAQKSD